MLLLVWNVELYLYDCRIMRYISEMSAIAFIVGFVMMSGVELDLVFVQGALEKDNNVIDLLSALVLGYNLALHAPTLIVNVLIVGKELTLNPFAWRKDQDFEAGMIYNTVNMDIFYWLGIGEDPGQYRQWLKEWGKEFL